jgi:hypothetical protein
MTPNEMLSMIAQLRRERDEAREAYDTLATEHVLAVNKLAEERDEARKEFLIANDKMVEAECSVRGIASVMEKVQRERNKTMKQVKEIIYIAERAIALAEIDFENDKFGVVSELRSDLEKIKEETK